MKIEGIPRRAPVLRKFTYLVPGSFPFHFRAASTPSPPPRGALCRLAATACGARPGAPALHLSVKGPKSSFSGVSFEILHAKYHSFGIFSPAPSCQEPSKFGTGWSLISVMPRTDKSPLAATNFFHSSKPNARLMAPG